MKVVNSIILFSCLYTLFIQSCKQRDYKDNTSAEVKSLKSVGVCSEIITNGDIDVTIMPSGQTVKAKVNRLGENVSKINKDQFSIIIGAETLGGSFYNEKAFIAGYFSTTCYQDKTILLKKDNDNPVPCAPVISANKFKVRNVSYNNLITQFNNVPSVIIKKDLKYFQEIIFEFKIKTDTGEEFTYNEGKTNGTTVTYALTYYGRKSLYTGTCSKDTVFAKSVAKPFDVLPGTTYNVWSE